MALKMALWKVAQEKLQPIAASRLDQEKRLEEWIARDSSLLGMNVLIFGRQVLTDYGGYIDLLGLDEDGDLVVIELKRDRTPRDVVAQVLDYGSWAKDLTAERIDEICNEYTKKSLSRAFQDRFGSDLPETLNSSHTLVIVASSLDDSSERIVQYLESQNVSINAIFFSFFKTDEGELVARSWLIDPEQATQRSDRRFRPPWSGFWFVNVGEDENRNWEVGSESG